MQVKFKTCKRIRSQNDMRNKCILQMQNEGGKK